MSCGNRYCLCCRSSYLAGAVDGLSVGFALGRAVGRAEGYIKGYVDGSLGLPPPPHLRSAIEERMESVGDQLVKKMQQQSMAHMDRFLKEQSESTWREFKSTQRPEDCDCGMVCFCLPRSGSVL